MIHYFLFVLLVSINGVLSQSEFMNSQVDIILGELSSYLVKDNASEIELPDLSYNYLVAKADLRRGFIKDLSSIQRDGNVNAKLLQGNKTLMLSFAVGFESLEFFYSDVDLYVMMTQPINNVNATVKLESVKIDLGVMLSKDFHGCTYSISVMTAQVGWYSSDIGNIGGSDLDRTIISWIANRILSYMTDPIESFLTRQIEPILNRELANIESTDIQRTFCNGTKL